LQAQLLSDGELADHELDATHARALRAAGPWGQGFAEPLFDGVFTVVQWRVLKERHLKLVLRTAAGLQLNAIWFGGWHGSAPEGKVQLAYRLVEDDYRGGDAVQLMVEHLQPAHA
jgi:single-stranded-DNA-specific exonuclease